MTNSLKFWKDQEKLTPQVSASPSINTSTNGKKDNNTTTPSQTLQPPSGNRTTVSPSPTSVASPKSVVKSVVETPKSTPLPLSNSANNITKTSGNNSPNPSNSAPSSFGETSLMEDMKTLHLQLEKAEEKIESLEKEKSKLLHKNELLEKERRQLLEKLELVERERIKTRELLNVEGQLSNKAEAQVAVLQEQMDSMKQKYEQQIAELQEQLNNAMRQKKKNKGTKQIATASVETLTRAEVIKDSWGKKYASSQITALGGRSGSRGRSRAASEPLKDPKNGAPAEKYLFPASQCPLVAIQVDNSVPVFLRKALSFMENPVFQASGALANPFKYPLDVEKEKLSLQQGLLKIIFLNQKFLFSHFVNHLIHR